MNVKDRLLDYVSVHTQSEDEAGVIPSTKRQFDLAKKLEKELNDLHLEKVKVDDHCYVYGLLPATPGMENKKPVGFIAHMDTSPDYCGENVKPQIIENYDGGEVVLKGTGAVLSPEEFSDLETLKGRTLITTDGTTLLGADDKAGIAEILTAVEEIINEKLPHGDIWVGFTPDEEVGCGADMFDLDYFKAEYAYTLDGDYEGGLAFENFNASTGTVKIVGKNVHPGSAKDIMINAASIACEFQGLLPRHMVPEHTTGRDGFFHLIDMKGGVTEAEMTYIIRDHDADLFQKKAQFFKDVAKFLNEKYGEGVVTAEVKEGYHNMLEVIEKNYYCVEVADKAMRTVGLTPEYTPIRGGTDGAKLSFMGLPCPNLGTGGYAYHGPFEHITVEGMEIAVKVVKEIVANAVDK
ncbi:MAG: peptidase T [Lachnospiraceae bacterium]|nr:peptidase T [Lachnospiraceae bacterium]